MSLAVVNLYSSSMKLWDLFQRDTPDKLSVYILGLCVDGQKNFVLDEIDAYSWSSLVITEFSATFGYVKKK